MSRRRSTISARDYESVDIGIRALRVFLAVQETGSMAAAGRALGIGKSSVSQHVANLEVSVGTSLIDRRARPLALTPAGTVFRHHVHRILNAVSEARADLLTLNGAPLCELRLGIIDDLDASLTPELVEQLAALYPGSAISASSRLSDALSAMLVSREADIVMTADPPEDIEVYAVARLLCEPFVVVCPRGLLAGASDVAAELWRRPFVRYTPKIPIGRRIEEHLARVGFQPSGSFAFDASRSVFAMVLKCGGWAITTPLNLLDSERSRQQLDVHPLPFASMSRTIFLVWRRGELDALALRLAEVCRSLLRERLVETVNDMAPWAISDFHVYQDKLEEAPGDGRG